MDNAEYLKQLAETQKQTKRTELEQARAEALRQSNLEKEKVLPTFETAKQQTNVQSQIGAKNLAEFWARRGQTQQGISAQAELSRQNVLGRDLGAIDTQREQAVQDFANQNIGIQNQYNADLNNAYGQIDTNLASNLYDERVRQQQIAEARRSATIAYNRSKSDNEPQILKGVLIPHDYAVQNQIQGVKIDNKTMRYQVGNDFVDVPIGVNPFTGKEAPGAYITDPVTKKKTLAVMSNGYQPKYYNNKLLSPSEKKANINGQEQTVWQTETKIKDTKPNKLFKPSTWGKQPGVKYTYVVWDGAANKYWALTSQEKKDLGLK